MTGQRRRPVPPVSGPGRRRARRHAARRARLLRMPRGGSERRARPDRDLPTVRSQPRGRRVQGLAGLDLPLDPESQGLEPRHEDAEPPPDRRPTRWTSPSTFRRSRRRPASSGSRFRRPTRRSSSQIALYFADVDQDALRREGRARRRWTSTRREVYAGREPHRALRLLRLPRDSGFRRRQADRHGADRGRLEGRPPARLRLHPHPAHAARLVPHQAPRARASSIATARAAGKRSSACRTSGSRRASWTRS